jgi:lysophospholipase L1-like esterase
MTDLSEPTWREVPGLAPPAAARPLRRAVLQLGLAAIVAGWLGARGHVPAAAGLLVVVGVVSQGSLVSPRFERTVATVLHAVGWAVGRVLTFLLLGLTMVFFVMPVALLTRLLRVDLLAPGQGAHPMSLWLGRIERARSRRLGRRSFADDRAARPAHASRSDRVRQVVAGFTVAAIFIAVPVGLWALVVTQGGDEIRQAVGREPPPGFRQPDTAALEDEPWVEEFSLEYGAAESREGYRPWTEFGLPTFHGRHLNMEDLERVSYEPGGLGTDALEVWVLGGSAVFGLYQRDQHTIPSELARLAEADGVEARFRNFGIPSYLSLQEAMMLARRLAAGGRPDLVVFYDGYNDTEQAQEALNTGYGDNDHLRAWFTPELATAAANVLAGFDAPPTFDEVDDVDAVAEATLGRYRRAVDLSRHLADAYGFEVVHAWQPVLYTKRLVPGEEELIGAMAIGEDGFTDGTEIYRQVREGLPGGVIDLSTALDGLAEPVLSDEVHTDETGARAVAEALYPELAPLLRARAGSRP